MFQWQVLAKKAIFYIHILWSPSQEWLSGKKKTSSLVLCQNLTSHVHLKLTDHVTPYVMSTNVKCEKNCLDTSIWTTTSSECWNLTEDFSSLGIFITSFLLWYLGFAQFCWNRTQQMFWLCGFSIVATCTWCYPILSFPKTAGIGCSPPELSDDIQTILKCCPEAVLSGGLKPDHDEAFTMFLSAQDAGSQTAVLQSTGRQMGFSTGNGVWLLPSQSQLQMAKWRYRCPVFSFRQYGASVRWHSENKTVSVYFKIHDVSLTPHQSQEVKQSHDDDDDYDDQDAIR